MADDARQNPGDPVLRDQAAAGERRGEFRAVGREPHIAHQCHRHAHTGARAVDRRDDGFAHRRREVGMARTYQLSDIGVRRGIDGGGADRREVAHVGPCAEGTAVTGHHDRADVGIGLGVVETEVERGGQAASPAVHPVGAVERQDRDAGVEHLVEHRFTLTGGDGLSDAISNAHPSALLRHVELDVCAYCTSIGNAIHNRVGGSRAH